MVEASQESCYTSGVEKQSAKTAPAPPAKPSLAQSPVVGLRKIYLQGPASRRGPSAAHRPAGNGAKANPGKDTDLVPLDYVVRDHIIHVYQAMGRNKTQAARVLEIDIKTLYNKLKRYGYD